MKQTFRIQRGDTRVLSLILTEPYADSVKFNPTGWNLLFTMKEDRADPDTTAAIQKLSSLGGFTVTDAANGLVDVTLLAGDFTKVDPLVVYVYDVQAQNGTTGAVKTVATGTIRVDDDVTKNLALAVTQYLAEPGVMYLTAEEMAAAVAAAEAAQAAAEAAAAAAEAAGGGGGGSGDLSFISEDSDSVTVDADPSGIISEDGDSVTLDL